MRFELGALRLLGHLPSLEKCVECGNAVEPAGRVAFGQLDGGVLCANCRVGKKQVVMVSAGALRTMAQLADLGGAAWRRTKVDRRSLGELRGLLNHYFTQLLGRKPKMHEYLGV
jgi:DNA repair protein RecO (recombination protein O)